jgi:hypothetical protein
MRPLADLCPPLTHLLGRVLARGRDLDVDARARSSRYKCLVCQNIPVDAACGETEIMRSKTAYAQARGLGTSRIVGAGER